MSRIAKNVNSTVAKICAYVVKKYTAIPNVWGYNAAPDHNNRRCVDYMVINTKFSPTQRKALGDEIVAWHIRMHEDERLYIDFMVWRGRAWRPFARAGQPAGWGDYDDPGSHFDHVHVQYGRSVTAVVWKPPPANEVTLTVIRRVQGYWGPAKPGTSKGKNYLRPVGRKLTGTIRSLNDGPYLVTRFGTWYPLVGNFRGY